MKNKILIFFLTIFVILSLCEFKGSKVEVIDGDTFIINGKTVRVLGIDTMEYKHEQKSYVVKMLNVTNVSCLNYYGEVAYKFAKNIIESSREVRYIPYKIKRGRIIATVYICNESCVDYSEIVISKGLAIVYRFDDYPKKSYYLRLEREAKEKKLGLWQCSKNN